MSLFDDDEEWGQAANSSGEFARVPELAGHLLIVLPIGYIEHHPTRFTQPGKKSDVIVCDLVDLDSADETTGQRGRVYRNAWLRQSQLIVSLRPWIGKKVLGRLGKGTSRNGMNPPWILNEAMNDPASVELARQWAAANRHFTTTPFQAPSSAAPAPAPQAPAYQPHAPAPIDGFGQYGGSTTYNTYTAPPPAPGSYQQAPPQYPTGARNVDPYAQAAGGLQAGYPAPQTAQVQQPQYAPPPAYAVDGSPQMDQNMLALMRAERERREAASYQQTGQGDTPPF